MARTQPSSWAWSRSAAPGFISQPRWLGESNPPSSSAQKLSNSCSQPLLSGRAGMHAQTAEVSPPIRQGGTGPGPPYLQGLPTYTDLLIAVSPQGLNGLNSRCQQVCSFLGASSRNLFPCLFQLLMVAPLLVHGPFHLQSQKHKDSCDAMG